MRKPFSFTVPSISFVLLHLACLAAIRLAFSWRLEALSGLRVVRDFRPYPASA
jgi:hypothetical protein